MDIVWYPTDKPFLEVPSVINSLDWDEEPWVARVVGEQFGYGRNYNARKPVEGLVGEHVCGEAVDFEEGQDWPYDGPPVQYDADDIPVCCDRALVASLAVGTGPDCIWRPPPNGCTCDGAYVRPMGAEYSWYVDPSCTRIWARFDVPAGVDGSVTGAAMGPWVVWRGTSCSDLMQIGSGAAGPIVVLYPTLPGASRIYVQMTGTYPDGLTVGVFS